MHRGVRGRDVDADLDDLAPQILLRALAPTDRVLILGAGGWLGSSLRANLFGFTGQTLAVASTSRIDQIRGRRWVIEHWDAEQISGFQPTVVANFAFLTREQVADLGEVEFERINNALLQQFEFAASLPSVRSVLTASSGAAVTDPDSPYGTLKILEERIASSLHTTTRQVVIARTYSISGRYVRRPRDYAFSDMIAQGMQGAIPVAAKGPVWRRYCDAGEYLALSLASSLSGVSRTIESGGHLVEMGDLAETVAAELGGGITISRDFDQDAAPSAYLSDGSDWDSLCADWEYRPMTLSEQIRNVHRWLLSEDSE